VNLCPSWVQPLSWADEDTEQTKREIFSHNILYEENCKR
jgi:hypothetical protein